MVKRRRLADLYVRGRELNFDDGEGERVTVYIRKLTPVDQEKALRRANAARSRMLSLRADPDEVQSLQDDVQGLEKTGQIDYLVADESVRRRPVIEAEIEADEDRDWAKDGYYQGLLDSWNGDGELEFKYAEDPEDPEAKRVFEELKRFSAEVEEALGAHLEAFRTDLEGLSDEALSDKVFQKLLEIKGNVDWLNEYRRCEIWLGTRDPQNHNERYFHHRDEVDDLSLEILSALLAAYQDLNVDVTEGKDSPGTPSSSDSSEEAESPATGQASGSAA